MDIDEPASASAPESTFTAPATAAPNGQISGERVDLLDDEGALTLQLEQALRHIFLKYATRSSDGGASDGGASDASASNDIGSYALRADGLRRFGIETNGSPIPDDQIEEMKTFLDCDEQQNLNFKGFIQMYQLQTENDIEETWRDLKAHGFDNSLQLQ